MSRPPVTADLGAIVEATAPALTPDGSAVLYLRQHSPLDGAAVSELWLQPLDRDGSAGTPPRRLTGSSGGGDDDRAHSAAKDGAPVVAPGGRSVAFVRSREGAADLYVLTIGDGAGEPDHHPVQLTDGLKVTGDLAYSPDGARIAFVALVDDTRADDETAAAPIVVDGEPQYKVDGAGWVGAARTQVFVVSVDGGEPVRLTDRGHAAAPAWSPSGQRIAFTHVAVGGSPQRLQQRIGLVDPARPRTSVSFPWAAEGLGGPLTWTPSGEAVVAIGNDTFTVEPAQLRRLEVDTGEVTSLTAELDRTVMGGGVGYPGGAPAFTADGRLLFCVRDRGRTVLYCRQPDGSLHPIDLGDGTVVSGLTVARDFSHGQASARAVVRVADPANPGDLVLVDLDPEPGTDPSANRPRRVALTRTVAESLPGVAFRPTVEREFAISDGTRVHGWLLRAEGTAGPAPTLLDIHGGPHNAWTGVADTAHLYHQVLAEQGWNVLTLNPRASDGYGRDFLRATLGAWGEADQADFLEPLDQLIAEGIADPDALAVTGYSYGGYMTCWLTSHTDRFRAAVPGGLVADHHTMSDSSDLGGWVRDIEIGDAAARTRLSPLTYVDRVDTPTLVLHGRDDLRCPVAQGESWYARLRENGVDSQMVIYPGQSHAFIMNGPVTHRSDYNDRVVDWVTRWTSGSAQERNG